LLDKVRVELGQRPPGPTDEMVERRRRAAATAAVELAAFARSEHAPGDLRAAQQPVDRGELTWEQLLFGPGS
jgi:hypothetical protein